MDHYINSVLFVRAYLGKVLSFIKIVTFFRDKINLYVFFHPTFYTGNWGYKAPFFLALSPFFCGSYELKNGKFFQKSLGFSALCLIQSFTNEDS